jgi:hypothetical protein
MRWSAAAADVCLLIVALMTTSRKNSRATAGKTKLKQPDVIRQSLKLCLSNLYTRLAKRQRRRLSLVEHFKRLKGLELPPYLDE